MSTGTHATNGHVPSPALGNPYQSGRAEPSCLSATRAGTRLPGTGSPSRHLAHLEFARVFAGTVWTYLVRVLPQARNEIEHWRSRATEIPARDLRNAAASAMGKVGNIEGAALFATLVPTGEPERGDPRPGGVPDRVQLPRRIVRAAEQRSGGRTPISCIRRCCARYIRGWSRPSTTSAISETTMTVAFSRIWCGCAATR